MGEGAQLRIPWSALPPEIHREVEALLGGKIVEAVSQSNGYSPGSADRVRTQAGRRAFVKAVSRERNAFAYEAHRRERTVVSSLPATVRAPRLVGSFSNEEWEALVLEDISGRHPGSAPDGSDALAVLRAVESLPLARGAGMPSLPEASEELAGDFAGLSKPRVEDAMDWLDGLTYLLDARLRGERLDADSILQEHPLFAGVPRDDIDSVLSGLMGMFFERARQPAPPSIPTIRGFQRDQALAAEAWLQERWKTA